MKKNYFKLLGSLVVMLCVVAGVVFAVTNVKASDEITETRLWLTETEYEVEAGIPAKDGYLFGGYFVENPDEYDGETLKTGEDGYKPVTSADQGEGVMVYAKFVPEEVLGIKTQISHDIYTSGEMNEDKVQNKIRFATSIDSTEYAEIGFMIQKGPDAELEKGENITNYVYESLYYIGSTGNEADRYETTPATLFESSAKYFKTYTITDVPAAVFDTDITVVPYWVTYDGTTVYGAQNVRTFEYCTGKFYVSSSAYEAGAANVGTKNSPATLETAVAIPVNTTHITPKIYVTDNIQIKEKVVINNSANVVLQNEADRVTITRGTGTTMFEVAAGCSLTIDGQITVDGNKGSAVKGPSMINNTGTFVLGEEAILQNAETGGSSDTKAYQGAALYNTGKAEIKGTVTGNGAYKGGAIYTTGEISISGNITNNTSTFQAGAMYVIDGSVTLKSDVQKEVSGNQAGNYGGAIYIYDGTLSAENYQFKGNKSSNTDNNSARGGVFYIAQKASVDVENCIFGAEDSENANASADGNASAYGGAIYVSGNLTVDRCNFHNNTSKTSGGAVGIHNTNTDSEVVITNSTFAKNDAKASSGAIDVNGSSDKIQVQGCTFTGNTNVNDGTISVRSSGKHVNISDLTLNGDVICVYSGKTVGISGSITGATIQLKATTSKVLVNGMLDSNITIKPSAYTVSTELVRFAESILEGDKESIVNKLVVDKAGYYIDKDGKLQQQ